MAFTEKIIVEDYIIDKPKNKSPSDRVRGKFGSVLP